ncbi:MAG: IclR family transcriptional regulator [Microbacterium sp.]|uniref:IclR family transcriptional regulator n=1 Tax=Microbacterium sp. TaxID=51671 RepID=UPI003D6DB198
MPARSAQRALSVLVLLAQRLRPLPTMTIARDLGIPKSSTHHLLNTMLEQGFVTYYEAEHAWGLGVRVFEIGSAYVRSAPLQRLGRPVLARLTDALGETAHLAVLHGCDVLYIDKEQAGGSAPQLVTEVGVRLPAHLTAVGRAILAGVPEAQVKALFANQPLVQRTGTGPTSVSRLIDELVDVRDAGYAVDREMVTPGIACVAAPVLSHESVTLAAIGVTFLSAKYSARDLERIAARVREASQGLSHSLGWNPGADDQAQEAA